MLGLGADQGAALDRCDHATGGRDVEALANAVAAAGPAGVDQVDLGAEATNTLDQQLGVLASRTREERRAEAGGEGRLDAATRTHFGGTDQRGVTGQEVVGRLLVVEDRHRRQHAGQVAGQEDHRVRLAAEVLLRALLDMGQRLGRFIGGYRDRFFKPDKRNREIIYSYKPRDGAEEAIYELISDICISMKAVDFLDMPEKISNRIEVSMDKKEQQLYESFQRDMVLSIKGEEIDAINAAGLSNKLLQMANGAVYGEEKKVLRIHDRKLEALEDLVEAANGKPLLVVYWYKHDLARIRERFDVRTIDTSKDIDDWNAGKIPVALIHPASAGHGLNLQEGGSTVVWFGLTWSLELYQQLNARLWRQGQKNTVVIQHIITRGTHDEDVMRALEAKDMRQSALIEAVKARIGGAV